MHDGFQTISDTILFPQPPWKARSISPCLARHMRKLADPPSLEMASCSAAIWTAAPQLAGKLWESNLLWLHIRLADYSNQTGTKLHEKMCIIDFKRWIIDCCELNGSLHLYIFVLGIIFREDDQGIADTLVDPIWIIMLEKLKNACIKDHKSVFKMIQKASEGTSHQIE